MYRNGTAIGTVSNYTDASGTTTASYAVAAIIAGVPPVPVRAGGGRAYREEVCRRVGPTAPAAATVRRGKVPT